MEHTGPRELLRSELLAGTSVLLARSDPGAPAGPGAAVRARCEDLGARVSEVFTIGRSAVDVRPDGELEAELDAAIEAGGVDALVVDAAELFGRTASSADSARAALGTCLAASWEITRAAVARAFIARERGGRVVFLAPPAGAGEHAQAATAGLENLARTLSIEWARRGVMAVAIAPGAGTAAEEVATLVAYLLSPAGAYFSGCLLDLRGLAR